MPTTRQEQREATRARILEAALEIFAERGFAGASTRDIASRAGTNQGLITYHFQSKEALWREAADQLFASLATRLEETLASLNGANRIEATKEGIREYVRFAAAHPELFRLMVDEGKVNDDRLTWLVRKHLKPRFKTISQDLLQAAGYDQAMLPHAFYALAGAASLMFAVAPECKLLTGMNPLSKKAIETHANFVADLIVD